MRDDAVLRRALPLGRGLGRTFYTCSKISNIYMLNCANINDAESCTVGEV